jgi:hypothetical protein
VERAYSFVPYSSAENRRGDAKTRSIGRGTRSVEETCGLRFTAEMG